MDFGISNKTALVTGASSGLGFAIAKNLCFEGTAVILSSRTEKNLEDAANVIRSEVPEAKISTLAMDLGDETSIRRQLATLEVLPDIVVNNTGGPPAGPVTQITLEQWDTGYASLLRSTFVLSEVLIPKMREKKWGRFLTLTSTTAFEMIAKLPVSATLRSGLGAWAKYTAKEVSRDGVLVNNLLPGPTNTNRLKELEVKSPEFYQSMESEMAIGRIPAPDELARVAVFLCSNANTLVTGTDVTADGGFTRSY